MSIDLSKGIPYTILINQEGCRDIEVHNHDSELVFITMVITNSFHESEVISIERSKVNDLIQALQLVEIIKPHFFTYAQKYYLEEKQITREDALKLPKRSRTKFLSEFNIWCANNISDINARIEKDLTASNNI